MSLANPPDPAVQAGLHGRPAVEPPRRFRSADSLLRKGKRSSP
jgi:hypothetical protein